MLQKFSKYLAFTHFRFVVAGILLLAAGLKAYQLSTAPLPPVVQGSMFTPLLELLNDRYFLMVTVVGEILFALVLIADLWRYQVWLLSLLGFSAFTFVSLLKGLSGESSCGCFGTITVNPWYTMGLDLVIATLLAIFRPTKSRNGVQRNDGTKEPGSETAQSPDERRKVLAVLLIWLALIITTLFAMLSLKQSSHATLGKEIIGIGGRKMIKLEPEGWLGKEFPLIARFVQPEDGEALKQGTWTVLLIHTDCPDCKKMMKDCEEAKRENVAIVVIPSRADEKMPESTFPTFMLDSQNDWYGETPCVVELDAGLCVAVKIV